jgi:polygalacturonase
MKIFGLASMLSAVLVAVSSGHFTAQEAETDACILSGTYVNGTDISNCSSIVISSLNVPAGVMLDLTKAKTGATIKFEGTSTFEPAVRSPPYKMPRTS